jgi:kynurenine 3-monooxygenase
VEIEMPAINKQCIVPNKYLHIFPRGGFKQMFAGLPNPDNSVTAAWYAPQTGTNSFNDIYSMGSARFFDKHFPVATQLVPDFIEQFDARKPSQLSEVRMKKTWHYKNFVIVGDAAHAVTPFYGQGMNFSMWLALKLNKLLRTMPTLESALDAFDLFMADANRLADWSQQNFDEMSTTNSPQLQLRKDIEAELEINYPKFASMHTKVCFRDIEYADIEKQMGVADGIFEDVLKLPNVYTNWKTTLFPKIVSMMVPA